MMRINKSELVRLALEVRAELGVGAHDVLDPYALASLYGVDVFPISEMDEIPEARAHFLTSRPERFSGALVPVAGGGVAIIENDQHQPERRMSTVSHEMAHILREHPFTGTLVGDDGCRSFNRLHEDEAAELGAELLIPTDAARRCAYFGHSDDEVASRFGISIQMAAWRMNATGARKIAQRARAKRGV